MMSGALEIPDELWGIVNTETGKLVNSIESDSFSICVRRSKDKAVSQAEHLREFMECETLDAVLLAVSADRFEAEVEARKAAEKARSDADHAAGVAAGMAEALQVKNAAAWVELETLAKRAEKAEWKADGLEFQLSAMRTRARAAEFELAAHRAEAERPIRVGDVVQYIGSRLAAPKIDVVARVDCGLDGPRFWFGNLTFPRTGFVRIGRAVLMPDGSPVPVIEGSV